MAKKAWAAFPHPDKRFDYAGERLAKAWKTLHASDLEPFPDEKHATRLLRAATGSASDAGAVAAALQDAWRAFHRGDFQQAFDAGVALGPIGASVAIKAGGIHASHLLDGEKARAARYEELVRLAEDALDALPDEANSHYRHAFALGRLSQTISITKALAQGLAGKVRESLEATLKLAPKHAEAQTALGLYHAEIVGKV